MEEVLSLESFHLEVKSPCSFFWSNSGNEWSLTAPLPDTTTPALKLI